MEPALIVAPIVSAFALMFGGTVSFLGIPPAEEDPIMAQVAPEECIYYVSWNGMAEPDPASGNKTEQFMANEEVRTFARQVYGVLYALMEKEAAKGPQDKILPNDVIPLIGDIATNPGMFMLEDLQIGPPGESSEPSLKALRAGMVLRLGKEGVARYEAMTNKILQQAGDDIPEIKTIDIDGSPFKQVVIPSPSEDNFQPTITWGVKGPYLIAGVGEGVVEEILQRGRNKKVPGWLTDMKAKTPIERRSTITYINIDRIRDQLMPFAPPMVATVLGATDLEGISSIVHTTGLDDEGLVTKILIGYEGEPRGLFTLADKPGLTAADLAPIPADATVAMVTTLDPNEVYAKILAIAEEIDPNAAKTIKYGVGAATGSIGLKLEADLLEPLGDKWCLFASPSEGGLATGAMIVVTVDDTEKLRETLDKLTSLGKMALKQTDKPVPRSSFDEEEAWERRRMPRVEEVEHADNTIYYVNVPSAEFPLAPSWCLVEGQLLVALFPQTIKAYLDRPEGTPTLASVPVVQEMLAEGSGSCTLHYIDAKELFELAYPFIVIGNRFVAVEAQRNGIDYQSNWLPSAGAISRHLTPIVTTARYEKGDGLLIESRYSIPGLCPTNAGVIMPALLLPAIQAAREAGRRATSKNNMKQLSMAILTYEEAHGKLPSNILAEDGTPLLSWRVRILPFLEQQHIYDILNLDEPWDSEHNKKLAMQIAILTSPRGTQIPEDGMCKTHYMAVAGKDTVFPPKGGIGIDDIEDGTACTISFLEVTDEAAVVWTKPEDLPFDMDELPGKLRMGVNHGGFLAAMCDGSVREIPEYILYDADLLKGLFTRNGGEEPVDFDVSHDGPVRMKAWGVESEAMSARAEAVTEGDFKIVEVDGVGVINAVTTDGTMDSIPIEEIAE